MNTVPFFPIVGLTYKSAIENIVNVSKKKLAVFATVCVLAIVTVGSDYQVIKNDCIPEMNSEVNKVNALINIVHAYPEEHIFTIDDTGLAEMLRTLDYGSPKQYVSYMTEKEQVEVYGYYNLPEYNDWLNESCIFIVCGLYTSVDNLKPELYERCEHLEDFQIYSIYHLN